MAAASPPRVRQQDRTDQGEPGTGYEEFADRSVRLANALRETLIACGLLDAVFVPLNTRLAPPEIQR
jgi:fatty-acyl-CoA synthase